MGGAVTEPSGGFGSYLRLLRTPGAATLALWGVVGRFPIGMRPISCILLVTSVTGSLGDAGTVAAAMLVAQGAASPVLGRLADRFSQRRVLIGAGLAHPAGMALLLTAVLLRAPLWLMVAAAVLPGCTAVSFTSFMRARWTAMVEQSVLRTAFALESMLDDTIFLLGPLLATALASAVAPAAGLVACLLLTASGSVAVALHHRSEPSPAATATATAAPRERGPRAVSVPGVRVMMAVYAAMGFQFGAIDVTLIAFAQERGTPGLSGVLLALTAVGSLVGGTVYGTVDWRTSQARLLAATALLLTLGTLPLALVPSVPLLMALLACVAGIAIAPAMIAGSSVLESVAPRGALSEAFSWLTSTGSSGIALGTLAGGLLAGRGGFALAGWAAAGGGLLALALSLAGQRLLQPRADPAPPPVPTTTATATATASPATTVRSEP